MFVCVVLLYVKCLCVLSCDMLNVCVCCLVTCEMFVCVVLLYVKCLCVLSFYMVNVSVLGRCPS